MKRRALKKRYGRSGKSSSDPVHLQVDWSRVACSKRDVDMSQVQASRQPFDVTCVKCKRAERHYDWKRLAEYKAGGGR
jgi:hypothetical protein